MEPSPELAQQLGLDAEEQPHLATATERAVVAVTDRRLIVKEAERFALDVPIEDLRRIQLDVERGRPATMVVVPLSPRHEPQVLAIPPSELEPVSRMVYVIGDRLARMD